MKQNFESEVHGTPYGKMKGKCQKTASSKTWNGEWRMGTGNGESLKGGIIKIGNL